MRVQSRVVRLDVHLIKPLPGTLINRRVAPRRPNDAGTRDGTHAPIRRVDAMTSATLQRSADVDRAVERLRGLGLDAHRDVREKSWDMCLAIESLISHVPRDGRILDVGARWSPILERLEKLGYKDLWACDLERSWRDDLRRVTSRSRVRFRRADLTDTGFDAASFDAITAMSVIEHGVDVNAYLREMARLLRPGGLLITSTDFWCEPVPTSGIYPYGRKFGEMRVFQPRDIRELIREARLRGLQLDGDLNLECGDRVVTWQRVGLSYTFTYFELIRE